MAIKNYFSPASTAEAAGLLREHTQAYPLAGGTDLLVQARAGRDIETVVDIKRIPGLIGIEQKASVIRIGAATPAIDCTHHPLVTDNFPGLAKATDYIGSSQIQGRCTIVGNLCNASPAADTVPALIANGAEVIVIAADGERRVPVDEFTTGPGKTVLGRGEFVSAIELPVPVSGRADAYQRFTPRTEMDIGVVSAGIALSVDASGTIGDACVAVGAVAATALKLDKAADLLNGQSVSLIDFAPFEEAIRQAAKPISDKRGTAWFRKQTVGIIAVRVAKAAIENAQLRGAR